jgi:signal transduction histidine kinase
MENLLHWVKNQMHTARVSPDEFDLGEVTDEAIHIHQLQAATKKITVIPQLEGSAKVVADRDMITLVFRNLLSNAIKYTPERGSIIIRLIHEPPCCRVSVIDTGIGMDQDTLARIQENSYYSTNGTASESGTGLGLMLCRDFLAKNGGKLLIESEPGKGSIFSFTLPSATA